MQLSSPFRFADGGESTCPICFHTWTVTPLDDCLVPACGCFGDDVSPANPYRPCWQCGVEHVDTCEFFAGKFGNARMNAWGARAGAAVRRWLVKLRLVSE